MPGKKKPKPVSSKCLEFTFVVFLRISERIKFDSWLFYVLCYINITFEGENENVALITQQHLKHRSLAEKSIY